MMKKAMDYLPLIAYLGYLFYGCFLCALAAGDARLIKVGFVSIPAIAAMLTAAYKIRRGSGSISLTGTRRRS